MRITNVPGFGCKAELVREFFARDFSSQSANRKAAMLHIALPPKGEYDKTPQKCEVPMASHAYQLNEEVHHQPQGPQGRSVVEGPKVYTIVKRMPIEADGRLRYRIKCKTENIERIATEDQLSHCG
jgi:hypothetical protein